MRMINRLRPAPQAEPWPGTDEGADALVERWHALRRTLSPKSSTGQVRVGGCLGAVGLTSPSSLPTKKTKRLDAGGVIRASWLCGKPVGGIQ